MDADFRRAVEFLDAGDAESLKSHLLRHPELAVRRIVLEEDGQGYFKNPALLDFVAENPVRRGRLPGNAVELARAVLDSGARDDRGILDSALALISSCRVARESGVQVALIDLLCDAGAEPDGALLASLVHGEFAAAEALVRRGARVTLPAAAAFGRIDDARRLHPDADAPARHAALALGAQHGHAEVVALLLDAGENPDRYNPANLHAHSTPLHQAALAGHDAVVRLLVERGARLDIKDRRFDGTARDWANYAGHTEIARYLCESPLAG